MSRDEHLGLLLPPRVKQTLESAKRNPTRHTLHTFLFWFRRHERDVKALRAKVDARVDKRREEYYSRGLSPDHKGFITTTMSDNMELLYRLECGIAAAVEEYKVLKAKVEGHGT